MDKITGRLLARNCSVISALSAPGAAGASGASERANGKIVMLFYYSLQAEASAVCDGRGERGTAGSDETPAGPERFGSGGYREM